MQPRLQTLLALCAALWFHSAAASPTPPAATLPLDVSADYAAIMREAAFLDPMLGYQDFSRIHVRAISQKMQRHFEQRQDLLAGKQAKLLRAAFADILFLYHYVVARQQGLAEDYDVGLHGPQATTQIRALLIALGQRLAAATASMQEQADLSFQIALLQSLNEKSQAPLLAAWRRLAPSSLAPPRQRLLAFAVLLGDLQTAQGKAAADTRAKLERLSLHLGKAANTLLSLTQAELALRQGGAEDARFLQQLHLISNLCQSLPAQQKSLTLAALTQLWLKDRHASDGWQPPFATPCFQHEALYQALRERQALHLASQGQYQEAIPLLRAAEQATVALDQAQALNARLLAYGHEAYAHSGDAAPLLDDYHQALLRYHGHAYAPKLRSALQAFGLEALRTRCKPGAGLSLPSCEQMVSRLLPHAMGREGQQELKRAWAAVLYAHQAFAQAAAVYEALAGETSAPFKTKDLEGAITCQAAMAQFSLEDPWDYESQAEHAEPIRALLQLLARAQDIACSGEACWAKAAPLGVLQSQNGQWPSLLPLWLPLIKQNPDTGPARQAAGFLLSAAATQERWDELAEVASLLRSHPEWPQPQYRGAVLAVDPFFKKALLKKASLALATQQYKAAVSQLQALQQAFPEDPAPEKAARLQLLAEAWEQLGDAGHHRQTLEALVAATQAEPNATYHRALQALAASYRGSGLLEGYARLVAPYLAAGHKAVSAEQQKALGTQLLAVYNALGNHSAALALLDSHLKPAASADSLAYGFWIDQRAALLERLGDHTQEALAFARDVSSNPRAPLLSKLRAIHLLAQAAYTAQSVSQLRQLETLLNHESFNKLDSHSERQYVWFLQMKTIAPSLLRAAIAPGLEARSLSVELANLREAYGRAKSSYAGLCPAGMAEHFLCGPALQATAELIPLAQAHTAKLVKQTELVSQADASGLAEIAAFDSYLRGELQLLQARLRQAQGHSTTLPELVNPLLWNSLADWNFARGHDSQSGYLQLSTSRPKGVVVPRATL